MIKINLVAETPAAAATQASRPQFSLGAKQGDIVLLIVLALACIVVGILPTATCAQINTIPTSPAFATARKSTR